MIYIQGGRRKSCFQSHLFGLGRSGGYMIVKTEYHKILAYRTKDGSLIRELMHPDLHGNAAQSLAEALIPPGSKTQLHKHHKSEEIYHFTAGTGFMTRDRETFPVRVGDTVFIPVGTPHQVINHGTDPLKLLCCCAPPYSHDDTELLEER